MNKRIIEIVITLIYLLAHKVVQAQGTVTYLSNLAQPSVGSLAVGSNAWFAADFITGTNIAGYLLNSIQLEMITASGNPNGFTVLLYGVNSNIFSGSFPGNNLATLSGSLNPSSGGNYTYVPTSALTISPMTDYFVVLTTGAPIVNGAYEWSLAGVNSYNPSGHWAVTQGASSGVFGSANGLSWNSLSGTFPQFAISATAIPEPNILSLFGLGALAGLWRLRTQVFPSARKSFAQKV